MSIEHEIDLEEFAPYVKQIVPTDDRELKDQLLRCLFDCAYFTRMFMPEIFNETYSEQEDECWIGRDDQTIPKWYEDQFRSGGKSARNIAQGARDVLFRIRRYPLYVGQTLDHISGQTENLKAEFLTNENIREVFGQLKTKRYEGLDIAFSKKTYYVCDPVSGEPFAMVAAKGARQQVRGMNTRLQGALVRPDLVLVDDPEHDLEVMNEDNRVGYRRWFEGSLMKVPIFKKPRARQDNSTHSKNLVKNFGRDCTNFRVVYTDTPKHEDSYLARIQQDPTWKGVHLPIAEEIKDGEGKVIDFKSLIPEVVSTAEVRRMAKDHKSSGAMGEFYRELMCQSTSPDEASFTREMFSYYTESYRKTKSDPEMIRFVIVDPARTPNPKNAQTAMISVAVSRRLQKIFVSEATGDYLSAAEIHNNTLDLAVKTNSRVIGVEDEGLKSHIQQPFQNKARERSMAVRFIWLNTGSVAGGDFGTGKDAIKRARAACIVPYYESGQVVHEQHLRDSPMERQILSYPRPKRWDFLDCLGYIVQMLAELNIYFMPLPPDPNQVRVDAPSYDDDEDYGHMTADIASGSWRAC